MAESYKSELYAGLTRSVEEQLGLPAGLLRDIVTKGERSNASQVSEAGARTVFQVIPETRDMVLKQYGVDAYSSPENAALAAGYVLRDGMRFAKSRSDTEEGQRRLAAGYYHAGGDLSNWGPRTQAYMDRVQPKAQEAKPEPKTLASQYQDYTSGKMPADEKARFKAAIDRGDIILPGAMKIGGIQPVEAPAGAVAAYKAGKMPAADRAEFEALLKDGTFTMPGDAQIPKGNETAPAYTGNDAEMRRLQSGGAAPTAGQKAIGAAEMIPAALTAPLGLAGGIVGGVAGAGEALLTGKPVGATMAERAQQGATGMMILPKTQAGQEMLSNAASSELAQNLQALGPAGMTASLGTQAVGTAAKTAAGMAPVLAREAIVAAKPAVARAVEMVKRNPAAEAPKAAGGSVGSAGADLAALRRERAAQLDTPIQLTEGQATQNFGQQQFEREIAKNASIGAPIRQRMDEQNAAIQSNLSKWLDQTGAEAPDMYGAGKLVVDALEKSAKRAKAEVRLKYYKAERAGEMEEPVSLSGLVAHLNDQGPETITSPVLAYARSKAVQIGAAEVAKDGSLVAKDIPLKNAELLRKAIGNEAGTENSNIRQSSIMRGLIDESTATVGGQLYKEARAAHARFLTNFEKIGVIDSAMSLKKNSIDRRVAFENVFEKLILNASRDDLSQVRRVLQVQGGAQGQQAWKEMQGATVQWIIAQSTKNLGKDESGRALLSPAGLDKAIKTLDNDRRLEFMFGKQGAQKLRDLNDVAKDVFVAVPNSVNNSNTASVLAAMLESGVMSAATGIPIPIASGGRAILREIKDRKLKARVEAALSGKPVNGKGAK